VNSDHSALAGVDQVAWHELVHAYGSADDVPSLLHQLAAGVEAQQALNDLWGSICHQGSVYPASVAAAPFLAAIASSGLRAPSVLGLLGAIAESADTHALSEPDMARDAVAAQFDLLAPLAAHEVDGIRSTTVFTLSQSGPAERVVPLLVRRWSAETDPEMRAGVLAALAFQGPSLALDIAESVLGDGYPALVRLSAALTVARCGGVWNARAQAAVTAWIGTPTSFPSFCWGEDLFIHLVKLLAHQHSPSTAAQLTLDALGRGHLTPAAARNEGLEAARHLVRTYRGTAMTLMRPLARLLELPDDREDALSLLRLIGPEAAAEATAPILHLASNGDASLADRALVCLIEWDDPRAAPLLADEIAVRPLALEAAFDRTRDTFRSPIGFGQHLLDAIRQRLRDLFRPVEARPTSLVMRMQGRNELIHLAGIVRAWGPTAAAAQDELIALLPRHPIQAADALAALGHLSPANLMRLHAAAGSGTVATRLAIARALRALTEDTTALRDAVAFGLSHQRDELAAAATAASELPGPDTELKTHLERAVRAATPPVRTTPDIDAHLRLAHAYWQHTGDPDLALPALRSALSWAAGRDHGQWTAVAAADVAVDLAEHARDLLPDLEALLIQATTCPAAAHALLNIDPRRWSGEGRDELAAHLIEAIEHGTSFRAQHRAVDVLGRLAAPLPQPARSRLHALAKRERRILSAGLETASVRNDENLRRAIRALLSAPDATKEHP
jgi:hypothetical protein